MSWLFKRGTLTREVPAVTAGSENIPLERPPVSLNPITGEMIPTTRLLEGGAPPPSFDQPGGPPVIGTRQVSQRTAPPILTFLADFLAGMGGPGAAGPGIRARQQSFENVFEQAQREGERQVELAVGDFRRGEETKRFNRIQDRLEAQADTPEVKFDPRTGDALIIDPVILRQKGRAKDAIVRIPVITKPEDFDTAIDNIEKRFGLTLDNQERSALFLAYGQGPEEFASTYKSLVTQRRIDERQEKQFTSSEKKDELRFGRTLITQNAAVEDRMRDDYEKKTKTFRDVRDSFDRVQSALSQQTPASDLSLVFAYMKMLDPTSVVREGEFATAEATAGVPARIRNVYNKVLEGIRLTPEQRIDFGNQANGLLKQAGKRKRQVDDQFIDIAKRRGLNPENIIQRSGFEDVAISSYEITTPSGRVSTRELTEAAVKELESKGFKLRKITTK